MDQLWIQFDAERGYSLTQVAKKVEDWLATQGRAVTLRRGEDYTWIGEVDGEREDLSALRGRLEQLLDTGLSTGAHNCLLVAGPKPAAQPGPRFRPSSIAERIAA